VDIKEKRSFITLLFQSIYTTLICFLLRIIEIDNLQYRICLVC